MNSRSIVLAAALGLSLVNMANAVNYVYMTGSTAARTQVYNTLNDVGVVFDAAPSVATQGSATPSKCSYMNFTGHLVGDSVGTVTTIKCHWSGSEGGITDLVGGTEQFLTDAAPNDTGSTPPGPFTSSPVDLAMTDNAVGFSQNPNAALTGAFVGVIPFKWVKEKGSLSTITNVTDVQLRVLLTGGSPAALLTGNAPDTNWVYISGRDQLSGTRVNTYGITRYGIGGSCNQLEVSSNGSMITQPDGGIVGNYGYSSGGSLATQMGYDLSAGTAIDSFTGSHFSVIGYLGYGDANSAIANGGVELAYNGVVESTAAIQAGQYGFWGNEYLYRKTTATSQAASVYNLLAPVATGINAHSDNLTLIDQRTMKATRSGPTSDPIHN
jgi:hypothetical protein